MRLLIRILCVILAATLTSCSSFEREWRQPAASREANALPRDWSGRWKSAKHRGAGGRLRCMLTKVDERHYRAQFRAQWLAFSSSYAVTLDATTRGKELRLSGDQQLTGVGAGLYHYEGRVTQDRFTATYASSYDRGTFEMTPASR